MRARPKKSENAARMVRLMGSQPTHRNKVNQQIIQLALDISHPSAMRLQMAKFLVNTLVHKVAWSINKATASRWAILQPITPIHHTLKATLNTPSNVSSSSTKPDHH